MSDQRVDCGTGQHTKYKVYADVMMFFYPVGIPLLYFVLLYRAKEKLKAENRGEDELLHKIAFLWESYEPRVWWFEISSGAVQLGSDWEKKRRETYYEEEYEKKPRAKEDENWEPPPPPPEGPASTWDNNVFTNGGKGRPAVEIEMRSNPMHGEGAEEAEKDMRHLDRMLSEGFQAKPGKK